MTDKQNTGLKLRSLYESDGGVRAVFSSKVADYIASRPDYPAALLETLKTRCAMAAGALVADVGAGTGLLTRDLLSQGWRVVAVEPNAAMRAAADAALGGIHGYRSVEGCAEAMPLADASVDLVTAAQAFHWFEIDAARSECLRVLKPQGQVALIWNDRVPDDPVHLALDDVFAEFGGEKRAALVAHEGRRSALLAHEDRAQVPAFFGAGVTQEFEWPHEHRLDEAGLTSLVFSRSYIPQRGTQAAGGVEARVRGIFQRFASAAGAVTVRYSTVAIIGRPA